MDERLFAHTEILEFSRRMRYNIHVDEKEFFEKVKNSPNNVKFKDMVTFLKKLGFIKRGQKGSHNVFKKDGLREIVNIQNKGGYVVSYQVKQIMKLVKKYDLL